MSGVPWAIYIGFDSREAHEFAICRHSIESRLTLQIPVFGITMHDMQMLGYYKRKTEIRDGKLWDTISEAPMSTEFAITRFLTPHLAKRDRKDGEPAGWALFMDSDMLVRENLVRLFELADPKYAVMCVKHKHAPSNTRKMDDQTQLLYARKNWSSLMLFNCDHPANDALNLELINSVPGRDLHRFCWLKDEEIGELSPEWNWLIGHNAPKIVHFTEGSPRMPGYENCDFADEWREASLNWVRKT